MSKSPITSFSGKYDFLSNFYTANVIMDRRIYPTVEHAFQAAKSFQIAYRLEILKDNRPKVAKRLGRKIELRPDWEDIKFKVMEKLLRRKFEHEKLKYALMHTEGRELVEGNTWGDKIWGQCPVGVGENHLGKLLMKIREELLA